MKYRNTFYLFDTKMHCLYFSTFSIFLIYSISFLLIWHIHMRLKHISHFVICYFLPKRSIAPQMITQLFCNAPGNITILHFQKILFLIQSSRISYQFSISSHNPVARNNNRNGVLIVCHTHRAAAFRTSDLYSNLFITSRVPIRNSL